MDINLILIITLTILGTAFLTFFLTKKKMGGEIDEYDTLSEALSTSKENLAKVDQAIDERKKIKRKLQEEVLEKKQLLQSKIQEVNEALHKKRKSLKKSVRQSAMLLKQSYLK